VANAQHLDTLRLGSNAWNSWRIAAPETIPDLADADLKGLDLRRADLRRANLELADLTRANLDHADLRASNVTRACFREAVLHDANLTEIAGAVQADQFAGADLAGARLPDGLGDEFKEAGAAKEISENAQKLFVAVLAACLYSWLTIATTTDISLITNRASSPLPIIQTSIPIVGFYVVTPVLLLGVYFYFHFYLQKLWEELSSLPAIFPDGRPLYRKADPWLLSDIVRAHVCKLRTGRPFFSYLQQWISVFLAWWLVPITLLLFWVRYLPRHELVGTVFHCTLAGISVSAAIFLYRLSADTLRGVQRRPFAWQVAMRNTRAYSAIAVAVGSTAILTVLSIGADRGIRTPESSRDWWPQSSSPWSWVPKGMALARFAPFANLRGADLSVRPPTWTGKNDAELDSVKGLQLSRVDLRYADLREAFLVGSLLAEADLEGADLLLADLRQAQLSGAHLENADLLGARLKEANLVGAHMRGAELTEADLSHADITYADFTGTKGLTVEQIRQADHFDEAFYDSSFLPGISLAADHNKKVEQDRKAEEEQAKIDPAAAAAARVRQLSRLIGRNPELSALAAKLVVHSGGVTSTVDVPIAAASKDARSFTPPELAKLYNFPADLDGRGQAIGIVELGGGYRDSDLNTYFATLKLPRPNVTSVPVAGQRNSPSDPNGADGQVALDLEVSGAVAPKAQIVVYFAPNNDQGYLQAIEAAMADSAHRPSVLLIDWGSAENVWQTAIRQSINNALGKAAARGITVVVAAGDDGARENQSDGKPHVDFPASSPWVLAVGGTRLIAAGNAIASETVWNDGKTGGATGGGISEVFPRPDWQSAIAVAAAADSLNGRALPDVAANASPTTGYQVLVDGQRIVIGGTSAAAPLWAGLIALLNQGLGHNIGHFNPTLYQKLGPSGIFHAVTVGNNSIGNVKGYPAGSPWNACTGWGTPDGKRLLEALKK
jgi:uncharacterized protein YjbI with pentapeptide repeats